jgi:hypothetical protein
MKKYLIGLVLVSLLSSMPAHAAISNGFNTDYCYAMVSGGGGVNMYDQTSGSNMGNIATIADDTMTFSASSTPGVNTPAGARMFTASGFDRSGDGKADDIVVREYDAAGNELRRSYLYTAFGGYLAPDLSKPLMIGTLRYNSVNNTLVVSANPGNKTGTSGTPSKAWEFQLPDWASSGGVTGGTVTPVHTYTLLSNYKNRTCIDVAPDGTMYATGYNYGSGTSGRSSISSSSTIPGDPQFDVNTVLLDGVTYFNNTGDTQHYQLSAIAWRQMDAPDNTPEILTCNESTTTLYQPYAWRFNISGVGGGPYPILARVGTPGADIAPACNRRRGIRAQRDPLTGEVFMVGNDGGPEAGVLQVRSILPRNTGSMVFDPNLAIVDAASPAPEPATLLLLALGLMPMLRRRR